MRLPVVPGRMAAVAAQLDVFRNLGWGKYLGLGQVRLQMRLTELRLEFANALQRGVQRFGRDGSGSKQLIQFLLVVYEQRPRPIAFFSMRLNNSWVRIFCSAVRLSGAASSSTCAGPG